MKWRTVIVAVNSTFLKIFFVNTVNKKEIIIKMSGKQYECGSKEKLSKGERTIMTLADHISALRRHL